MLYLERCKGWRPSQSDGENGATKDNGVCTTTDDTKEAGVSAAHKISFFVGVVIFLFFLEVVVVSYFSRGYENKFLTQMISCCSDTRRLTKQKLSCHVLHVALTIHMTHVLSLVLRDELRYA